MSTREEKILNNEFFADKQDLAKQIIDFENLGKGFLPNTPTYKISPIQEINETQINIGRIHDYYYLAIKNKNGSAKHQLFENESNCKQFFIKFDELSEKQLAFWLNQIELLA